MRYFHCIIPACALLLLGSSTSQGSEPKWTASVAEYSTSKFSLSLHSLLIRIERGDRSAWREFLKYGRNPDGTPLDGEYSQTYSVALADLAARDPTFYLRRYLNGDRAAIQMGHTAYGWAGEGGRRVLDGAYSQRLRLAGNAKERSRIQTFILETSRRERRR